MYHAFFFDDHFVETPSVRNQGRFATHAEILKQVASPMFAATFFVGRDGKTQGGLRMLRVKRAKHLEHDGQLTLHVPGARPNYLPFVDVGTVSRYCGMGNHIQMATEQDLRVSTVFR